MLTRHWQAIISATRNFWAAEPGGSFAHRQFFAPPRNRDKTPPPWLTFLIGHPQVDFILSNPRQVLSREQLFDQVWGSDSDVVLSTVDRYVSYVRAKVDGRTDTRLIHTVRGVGYTLRRDDEGN